MANDDYSDFISDSPGTSNVRMASEWVPGEPRTHATQFGPEENPLQFGVSAAVSPNLAQGHELHEPFEVYHEGKLVGRYNYDDRSFYSPGNPTYNTVERYGLPDLGQGYSIKWMGKPVSEDYSGFLSDRQTIAKGDYSGFLPEHNSEHDYSGFVPQRPADQSKAWNLGQSIQNIWDYALKKSAEMGVGAAVDEATQKPLGSDPYEQRIKEIQIDPNLNDQQKQESIAETRRLQEQHRATEVPKAQAAFTEAEKQVQKDKPSQVEQILGSTIPYAASGAVGAVSGMAGLSALAAAQQASSEMYADALRDSVDKSKKANPGWSDAKVMQESIKAASEASKASGASMLALSLVHIDAPQAWPIISRIVSKIGLGAATMEVANSLSEVQKNLAIKKNIDPQEDWLGQLRNIDFHVSNLVTGAAFGGAASLGEIGRPSVHPIEDRVPIAEVPDTKEEISPSEKAKRESDPALKKAYEEFGNQDLEERLPRGYHFETDEKGMTWTVAPDGSKVQGKQIPIGSGTEPIPEKPVAAATKYKGEVGQGTNHWESFQDLKNTEGKSFDDLVLSKDFEEGFVTNTGRFVSRDEAWKLSQLKGTGKLHATDLVEGQGVNRYIQKEPQPAAAPVEQPPVTGTDPWLSSIANRWTQQKSEAGEIGPITPGKGTTPEAMLAQGTQMGPEQIAQHVSDLMQEKGDFRNQAAAVRAEEARLSQNSARLSRIAEENPKDPQAQANAEEAFQHLTDFHNGPVAKLKNNWHAAGEAMQGQVEVDLGSFNGLRQQWLRDVGKDPSPKVQKTMRETARKVREAQTAESTSMQALGKEIDRQTSRRRLPNEDEVRKNILARMNGDQPCGV